MKPIHVFCPWPEPPTVAAIAAFAASRGVVLTPFEDFAEDDPEATDWDAMGFAWRPGRPPIFVEIERLDAPDARHVRAEIASARRALDAQPAGPDRDEARTRLRGTRFVAGVAAPAEGLDDAGWRAADAIMACFERQARGVAWVVGRGFYLDERPIGEPS